MNSLCEFVGKYAVLHIVRNDVNWWNIRGRKIDNVSQFYLLRKQLHLGKCMLYPFSPRHDVCTVCHHSIVCKSSNWEFPCVSRLLFRQQTEWRYSLCTGMEWSPTWEKAVSKTMWSFSYFVKRRKGIHVCVWLLAYKIPLERYLRNWLLLDEGIGVAGGNCTVYPFYLLGFKPNKYMIIMDNIKGEVQEAGPQGPEPRSERPQGFAPLQSKLASIFSSPINLAPITKEDGHNHP